MKKSMPMGKALHKFQDTWTLGRVKLVQSSKDMLSNQVSCMAPDAYIHPFTGGMLFEPAASVICRKLGSAAS